MTRNVALTNSLPALSTVETSDTVQGLDKFPLQSYHHFISATPAPRLLCATSCLYVRMDWPGHIPGTALMPANLTLVVRYHMLRLTLDDNK